MRALKILLYLLLYCILHVESQQTPAQSWVSVRVDPTKSIFAAIPRFDQSSYEIFVTENQAPAVITTLRAFHRAAALHQDRLIYSLLTSERNLPFSIEANSGQLAVIVELDREVRDRYNFQVRACLFLHPSVCGVSSVTLFVNDLNDNTPRFPSKTYHLVVPNDLSKGSEVVQLVARDMDSGSNGIVTYAINPPSETFAIDHSSGQVSLLRTPEKSRYSLIIEAFDHGVPRRTTYAELKITVEGSNPSAPQFDQSSYSFSVESPVRGGQVVGTVHATDPDPGEDGMVTYTFANTNDKKSFRDQQTFSINSKTGSISAVTPLTVMDGPFHLVIIAADQNPTFSRKTQVNVKIEVQGGTGLRFLPLPAIVYISSEKPSGSVILRASAYTSGSTDVRFRAIDSPQELTMEGDSLKVIGQLKPGDSNITIRAETESAHVDHIVRVVVMNDRDKYPVFPKLSYDLEIPIESRFPMIVTRFEPLLENGTVKFSLFPPNRIPHGLSIDENTGSLLMTKEFVESPSNRDTVFLVIRAINSNYPDFFSDVGVSLNLISSTARVRFAQSIYEAHVRENAHLGTVLREKLEMESQSFPSQSPLMFSITPSNPLTVLPNGSFIVNDVIDLEKMPVDHDSSMIFVVTVSDGEQSASTKLRLIIHDVNEFLPKFDYMHYQAHIGEGALPGTPILRVHATDKDFFDATHLEYKITGGSGKDLVLIQQDGTIVLGEKRLDREVLDHFDVLIEAIDSGENSAEARVDITVTDANDNAPEILGAPLIWDVSEGEKGVGNTFTLLASDLDQTDNAKLVFTIKNGNEEGNFELKQTSPIAAVIRTVKALPRDVPMYKIAIEVRDSGEPPMMSVSTLTVNVRNEKDNKAQERPRFAQQQYTQMVPSDLPAGFSMLKVSAEGGSDGLKYFLSNDENCNLLRIGPNGELSFVNDDRGDVTQITCNVEVNDGINKAYTRIVIKLEKTFAGKPNRSNHPPRFERSNYVFRVDMSTVQADPRGRLMGMVSAIDNENDRINFSIEPAEYRNLFEVDQEGALWVRSSTSSSDISSRTPSFLIVATDSGSPPLASFANVRVVFSGLDVIETTSRTLNQAVDTEMSIDSKATMVTKIPELSTTVFTVSDDVNTSERPTENTRFNAFPSTQWVSQSNPKQKTITTVRPELTIFPKHSSAHSINPSIRSTVIPITLMPTFESTTTIWNKIDGGSEKGDDDSGMDTTTFDEVVEKNGEEETENGERQEDGDDSSTPFQNEHPFSESIEDISAEPESSTAMPSEFHFEHSMYFASMPEGRYSNGALLNLRPQSLTTNGEKVVYTLEDDSIPFHIRETTGEIVILDVDREKTPSFVFKVIAVSSDVSGFKMRAETRVNVTILDVNDNYPLFVSPPESLGVSSQLALNSEILRVQAIDADEGRNAEVTYEIGKNPWIQIDSQSGRLLTKNSLTNAPSNFELQIFAKDGGRPALKTTHMIRVRIFSSSSPPSLPKDSQPSIISFPSSNNQLVAQFLAGPSNENMHYRLVDDENGLFTFGSEGRLFLNRQPFDSEMNKYHQLNITAQNSRGVDSVLYNVYVEGPPNTRGSSVGEIPDKTICTFSKNVYDAQIPENLEGRHKLTKVTSDCESNGKPYEYVLWKGSDQFEIDRKTGEIFVNGALDRETRSIHFLFINVTKSIVEQRKEKRESINPVIEHAKSKLEAWQALVVIRVEDLNDNAPRFVRLSPEGKYSAVLDYQADPRNTHILQLQAQDNDEKTQFVYGIYGEDDDLFVVNATTGDLYLEKIVHDDQKKEYHLTGTVADGAHVSEIPITIYKLHPDWNLVQLTVEKGSNEVDVKLLVNLLNHLTNTEIHALVKEPFTGSDGQIDPTRTFVYVYGLESKTKKPIERNKLKGLLDRFSMALLTSETKVSSISLSSPSPSTSLSSVDIFLLLLCLVLLLIACIICCFVANICKKSRREEKGIGKDYMRSSPHSGPRPYDVSVIPRATAQAVLAGRPLPDPMQFNENKHSPGSSADERRSTNRSDELLVFANSVREYGGRENGAYDTNSDRISEGKPNSTKRHSSGRDSA